MTVSLYIINIRGKYRNDIKFEQRIKKERIAPLGAKFEVCLSRRRVRENKPIAIEDGSCPSNGEFSFLWFISFLFRRKKRKEMNRGKCII